MPRCRPRTCDGRSRRCSGAARTGRSGGPCLSNSARGGRRPRSSFAGRGSAYGTAFLAWPRSAACGLAWPSSTAPRSGRTPRRRGGQKGGPRASRGEGEALGRSRGGYGTKAVVVADGSGRAVAFRIAPGQAHELPHAVPLLDRLPGVPLWVVADRGYASHSFRDHVWSRGARPAIPAKRHEAPVACPDWAYTNRNRVERLWGRLKEWRAVATRSEKTARSFMGVLCLAASMDWLRR